MTHIATTATTTKANIFVQWEELTKRTTEIETSINEILKNVKSEVSHYWQILSSLKSFLQQEINNFQAGQVKYKNKISEWKKLTSDKEILQSDKGAAIPFDILPEMKPIYNFKNSQTKKLRQLIKK